MYAINDRLNKTKKKLLNEIRRKPYFLLSYFI